MRSIGLWLTAALAAPLLLASCASMPPNPDGSQPAIASPQAAPFADVPMPAGFSLDDEHSLAIGSGAQAVGKLVFSSSGSPESVFDFFRQEMPKFGWVEGAVASGQYSLLTFSSPATGRVAVVQILKRTFAGSHVELLVSTQSNNDTGSAAGQASALPPAPQPRKR